MARRSLKHLGSTISRRKMYNPLHGENEYFPAYDPKTEHPFKFRNVIKDKQKYFKLRGDDEHVYRKGKLDLVPYRGLMTLALGSVLFIFFDVYRMATGTLPKKERG